MQHLSFIAVYLVFRFLLGGWVNEFGTYAMSLLEVLYITAAILIYRPWGRLTKKLSALESFELLAFVGLGATTAFVAQAKEWIIPFDPSSSELVWWMVFLGPIIEEGIFRLALWIPMERLAPKWVWPVTSIAFSLSHFEVFFDIPEVYRPFVLFQCTYTLMMGFWWGQRWRKSSLMAAVLAHIAFNLGFWLMIR